MILLPLAAALAGAPPPIVNGSATDDYPQGILLRHATSDWRTVYICSGTLIAPHWVLTAAHCLTDPEHEGLTELDAYMGTVWSSDASERAADDWYTHPDYSVSDDGVTIVADLGLVHLRDGYSIDGSVLNATPITEHDIGTDFRYVGWGSSDDYSYDAGYVKREADIPLSGLEGEFLLGYDPDGSATCGGDSGGPVFAIDGDEIGALVAVHSFGRDDDGTLCAGSTSGDTRVDLYLDWITGEVADARTTADSAGDDTANEDDTGGKHGTKSGSEPPSGCATVPALPGVGWIGAAISLAVLRRRTALPRRADEASEG